MHFKISSSELNHHLQVASRALGKSDIDSTIEIILDQEASTMYVQATNGMFTISSICTSDELEILEEGRTRIQGKLFIDLLKSLKVSQVELKIEDNQLKIQADKIDLALKTVYEPDPYTVSLPEEAVEIDIQTLNEVTSKVEKAASRDESRPILTGILITVEDNILRMIATDSYRLAVAQTDVEIGNWEALVPVKSLLELIKLANTTSKNSTIKLETTSNILKASTENAVFNCRLIDGTLPNYESLVPKEFAHNFHFNVHDLSESVNMLSIISGPGNPIGFYFNQEGIKLSVDSGDKGQASEELSKEWDGEDFAVGFDPVYLKDGLDLMGEKASLKMVDAMRPSLLVDPEDANFLYLIMPLRLK